MARMIGKTQWHQQCDYGCCRGMVPKDTARNREDRQWTKEAEEELFDKHKNGMCSPDGCYECEPFDYDDSYDNSDLDDIPGVWSDLDWRRSLTEADFWFMEEWDERLDNIRKRREIEQAWEEHDAQNRDSGSGSVRASG